MRILGFLLVEDGEMTDALVIATPLRDLFVVLLEPGGFDLSWVPGLVRTARRVERPL